MVHDFNDDCAECAARGDDYIITENGEEISRCSRCHANQCDDDDDPDVWN